jgi:hypothetical protein
MGCIGDGSLLKQPLPVPINLDLTDFIASGRVISRLFTNAYANCMLLKF